MKDLFKFQFWSSPLRTWWKARKYFRRPSMEIHFNTLHHNCPFARYDYVAKIFHIMTADVMWKDKWNSPRHERDPLIWICFFHKYVISINFVIKYVEETGDLRDGGMYYWEYILDYLYYQKNLNKVDAWTYKSKVYKDHNGVVPTHLFSLNKNGLKEFSKYYKQS